MQKSKKLRNENKTSYEDPFWLVDFIGFHLSKISRQNCSSSGKYFSTPLRAIDILIQTYVILERSWQDGESIVFDADIQTLTDQACTKPCIKSPPIHRIEVRWEKLVQ